MPADYVGYLYAATVAAGGIFGYAKAGNTYNINQNINKENEK